MAIGTRVINDLLTEVYTAGGGNWLTENKATMFPTFCKRKILVGDETMESYREVTDAQKQQLEKVAADFVQPPQSFIDGWNNAARSHGRFNEATGYFELNGLTDITYQQAMDIYRYTSDSSVLTPGGLKGVRVRTNLPSTSVPSCSLSGTFSYNEYLEVVRLTPWNNGSCNVTDLSWAFREAKYLRSILAVISNAHLEWF